ncbi:dihydrofolate reductase [Nocardioides thalensis]|uniref:Dihydrofolate reductase n=1 Tax=Nocardioides thalensis TaxID=1914755 RepID=A0A853C723_9ACTN|nr:dihydrofolate reductase family protein [Nocardioides thalensis]NYJ02941.1 dihydrofolate reductase [Nocardioides thalensis]
MTDLVLQMQTSIDGYVDSSLGVPWGLWDWGPDSPWSADLMSRFNELVTDADAILLSRPMADGYADHWQGIAEERAGDPDFAFARHVTDVPKLVVTSESYQHGRSDHTVITGPLVDGVRQALERVDGKVICFGGASFASALLRAGLVDELQLFVNPGLAGEGARIFDRALAGARWDLLDSRAYECGIAVLRWHVTGPSQRG